MEGMLNSNDSSKQRVARQARRGRVVSAMQRCAVQLFKTVVADSRVSMFFKNSDPACKDFEISWDSVFWEGGEKVLSDVNNLLIDSIDSDGARSRVHMYLT